MTAVTLTWNDPEDASDFLQLRNQLRRDGWLPDPSADALRELVQSSEIATDGSDD
jgi:hypothetical protein